MGIFSGLFDTSKDDKSEKEVKRLKNLGLSDEEARLVREEGWDETSFEDDPDMEVEDDDYYGEDDFIDSEEDEDEWV